MGSFGPGKKFFHFPIDKPPPLCYNTIVPKRRAERGNYYD